MTGPGSRNEFAKKAKHMKFPQQMDNVDYGKKTKVVARTIDNIDSKTGKFYGTRTIMTKESSAPKWKVTYDYFGSNKDVPLYTKSVNVRAETADAAISEVKQLVGGANHKAESVNETLAPVTFSEYLIEASKDDITTIPDKVVSEIKGLIRKGAQDLQQAWKNALELTNTAYHVARVRLPRPDQKGGWKQYLDLISHAVKQLAATRGIDGSWRVEGSVVREAAEQQFDEEPIGKHRFFIEVPGESAVEVYGDSMDQVIDQIMNRIRVGKEVRGTKARIEYRDENVTRIGIYVNDILRDRIVIKDIS